MPDQITSFHGPYRFLSNFYPSRVFLDGQVAPTVEHAYQAAKTFDTKWRKSILSAESPGKAKQRGRMAELRPGWESIKEQVMLDLLLCKFSLSPDASKLGPMLLGTGSAHLVEGNHWGDDYWGECPLGNGRNRLGVWLMAVRGALQQNS